MNNNQQNQNQYQNQAQAPVNTNNNANSNQQGAMVPEARQALDNMKYEIAGELGINLKQGYNGDLPSRQAGYIGGYMVKRLIEQAERQMAGK
ncbi:MAG: alpha/beta-type small acid-soluble spore protein [Clostridia bacterium]|nr:alpha/beta-type small acid-soluble spore protein [Clostridia bacterium]